MIDSEFEKMIEDFYRRRAAVRKMTAVEVTEAQKQELLTAAKRFTELSRAAAKRPTTEQIALYQAILNSDMMRGGTIQVLQLIMAYDEARTADADRYLNRYVSCAKDYNLLRQENDLLRQQLRAAARSK